MVSDAVGTGLRFLKFVATRTTKLGPAGVLGVLAKKRRPDPTAVSRGKNEGRTRPAPSYETNRGGKQSRRPKNEGLTPRLRPPTGCIVRSAPWSETSGRVARKRHRLVKGYYSCLAVHSDVLIASSKTRSPNGSPCRCVMLQESSTKRGFS